MTLDTAAQVRLRITDFPAVADLTFYGDGRDSAFGLAQGAAAYRNITSGSAYVLASNIWSATGCTFNTSGWVTFSGVISANTAFRTRFVHSVFSDEEIGHFTAVGGSVAGAALQAVHALMFDGLKRAKWAAPDGSTYDDTAALAQLKTLYDTLKEELADADVANGGFVSWAEGQGDHW
ncbi:MAG: hypothetical protein EHM39_05520 [Chloroflexi bacterium]|nr:MAG: hypothetical protein EHM39_05520 [Chloroflexota bacterium]